jgi:hypothetical protein
VDDFDEDEIVEELARESSASDGRMQSWTEADRELLAEEVVAKHEASVIERTLAPGVPLGRIVAASSSSASASAAATAEDRLEEAILAAALVPDDDTDVASAAKAEQQGEGETRCLDRAAELWEEGLALSLEALRSRQAVLAAGTPVGGNSVRKELSIVVASDRISGSEVKSVILVD